MEFNLLTSEGRKAAVADLNKKCKEAFNSTLMPMHNDALFTVSANHIGMYIPGGGTDADDYQKAAFGSSVDIHVIDGKVTINFASSGAFTPANPAAYWRTMHAASLLKYWDDTYRLARLYTSKYQTLIQHMSDLKEKK